jgi:hypothetical protein
MKELFRDVVITALIFAGVCLNLVILVGIAK